MSAAAVRMMASFSNLAERTAPTEDTHLAGAQKYVMPQIHGMIYYGNCQWCGEKLSNDEDRAYFRCPWDGIVGPAATWVYCANKEVCRKGIEQSCQDTPARLGHVPFTWISNGYQNPSSIGDLIGEESTCILSSLFQKGVLIPRSQGPPTLARVGLESFAMSINVNNHNELLLFFSWDEGTKYVSLSDVYRINQDSEPLIALIEGLQDLSRFPPSLHPALRKINQNLPEIVSA